MGVVYTAYDPKLDRKVALKLLRRTKGDDARHEARKARMVREAQALAKLSHPNVITVHDVDMHDDRLFIAMEYVEGQTIAQWMHAATRSWREVVDVFVHAGRGLAAAHEAGIVHRDFKPGNVLLGDDGRVRVLDFGLAKTSEDADLASLDLAVRETGEIVDARSEVMSSLGSATDMKLTQAGRTVGTPAYMAPEQLLARPVGPATDQFSFGIALYEALYGQLPFSDSKRLEVLTEAVAFGHPRDPPREADAPAWVHRVVLRALQRRPEDRFPSMTALLAQLERDPARRRRRWLAIGVVAALAATGGAVAFGALAEDDDAACTGAADQIATTWNTGRAEAVRRAFAATKAPSAARAADVVVDALDDAADDWVHTRTQICEATNLRKDQSAALMDQRMACLDHTRTKLDTLAEVFEGADQAVVERSVGAVLALGDAGDCASMRPGDGERLPDDPLVREAVQGVDRTIARAAALESAGKYEEALVLADGAVVEARKAGHDGALARALLTQGNERRLRRNGDGAAESVREAVTLASRTKQAALEARAWHALILIDATLRDRTEAARGLQLPAELAIERAGGSPGLRAALEQNLAAAYAVEHDYDEALPHSRRALELLEAAHGRDHITTAAARIDLATILGGIGRTDDAITELRAAAEVFESTYGRYHPMVASTTFNLGSLYSLSGDRVAAREEYERALEISRKVHPSRHRWHTLPLIGLGQVELSTRPDRAADYLEEALDILEANGGQPKRHVALVHRELGTIHLEAARRQLTIAREAEGAVSLQAARRELEAAVDVLQTVEGNVAVPLANARRRLCEAYLVGEMPRVAVTSCEQAHAALGGGDESDAAVAMGRLADALARRDGLKPATELTMWTAAQWLDALDSPEAAEIHLALAQHLANVPSRALDARAALARAEIYRDRDELEGRAVVAEQRRLRRRLP